MHSTQFVPLALAAFTGLGAAQPIVPLSSVGKVIAGAGGVAGAG